jgi:hypothetical protein
MKKYVLIFIIQCCCAASFSQSIKKYPVVSTGCSAYFFCDPGTFGLSYSEDSSKIYMGECINDSTNYGILCIQLKEAIPSVTDAETMMVSYLDYLKTAFKITSAVGYGKGHILRGKENIHGIIDYWTDETKNNWKIKGWTDGQFITVMFAYGQKELPDTKVDVFLDGILFPGM